MSAPKLLAARGRPDDLGCIVSAEHLTLAELAELFRQAQAQPAPCTFEQLCTARAELKAAKKARDDAKLAGAPADEVKRLQDAMRVVSMRIRRWKETPWVSFGAFRESRRRRDTILTSTAAALDADQSARLPEMLAALDRLGCSYIVHTTTSHGCEGVERYRVIIPFAEPLTEPLARYPAVWEYLNGELGRVLDPGAKDATRLSYMPRVPAGALGHQVICVDNRPGFDPNSVPGIGEIVSAPREPALSALTVEQEEDLRAALAHPALLEALGDDKTWSDVGYALLSLGSKGFELFEFASRQAPNFEAGACEEWWQAHCTSAPQSDFRSIFKRAAALGWKNPRISEVSAPADFPLAPPEQPALANAADAADAVPGQPAVQGVQLQRLPRGALISNLHNATQILKNQQQVRICFDNFSMDVFIKWPQDAELHKIKDADFARVRQNLQTNGLTTICKTDTHDAVLLAAHANSIDRVVDYLNGLKWDGTRRLSTFLPRAFGTKTDRYHIRAGRNMLLSMVARAFRPGCKVDEALVFEGAQGLLKGTALRIIGTREFFKELIADPHGKDFELQLGGVWLGEFPELHAFRKHEDLSKIKQFVTAEDDTFRPPYARSTETFPRRTVLCGTTNTEDWLHDPTGNRRFIPIKVGTIDNVWLAKNRDQLFAEAVALFKAGRKWWVYPKEAARKAQDARTERDPWEDPIGGYLCGRREITSAAHVLSYVLKVPVDRQTKGSLTRVGIVLRMLGCTKSERRSVGGQRIWPWIVPDEIARQARIVPDAPEFEPVAPERPVPARAARAANSDLA